MHRPADDELGALLVAPTGTCDDLSTEAAMAKIATADHAAFSTAVAHDLKKAILSVAVDAQRLETVGHLPAHARAAIAGILRTAAYVDEMIQRLLDAASITAGRLELKPERVDLERLVGDAVEGLSPAERMRIDVDLGDRNIAMIDPVRFARALSTLLHVALDRASPGARVSLALTSRGLDRARLALTGALGDFVQELEWAFSTADVTRLHRGVAFQLRAFRTVVEAHGFEVRFDRPAEGAASFCMDVPVLQLRGMLARRPRRGATTELDDG